MGFPSYFNKNLQSASYLLQGIDTEGFKAALEKERVGIAFDGVAAGASEGRATLDLLMRLLARLCPVMVLLPQRGGKALVGELSVLAKAINPLIELSQSSAGVTRCISVGKTKPRGLPRNCDILFAGSDGWLAMLSRKGPVGSADTRNRFGAGAAACFAAANVFRAVFSQSLPNAKADDEVTFSMLEMQSKSKAAKSLEWTEVDIGNAWLVGCGAIGNGFLWAFQRYQGRGMLHAVDGEKLDETNLQRYAMTIAGDEGESKALLSKAWLEGSSLDVQAHEKHWSAYVSDIDDRRFDRLAVAVDTERARIDIQASLPRVIHNAWTQRGEAGTSRHGFLGAQACMACLYMPASAGVNFDELVQRALRLPDPMRMEVRRRLDLGVATERGFLEQIAAHGGIPMEQLQPFEGKKLDELYRRGACGGMVIALRDGETARQLEVPMAFQSTFAGILLAADFYAEVAGLRERLPTRTQINLLTALPPLSPSDSVLKVENSRCICADPDFIEVFQSKYGDAGKAAATPGRGGASSRRRRKIDIE